jgi:DNA repair exonuclease SbcCD ATPase subunit
MEIILETLKFNNMFSYGADNELDINKNKITQLTAPNGSGKSTIALIIQELLFSKNIKNIKKGDISNRYATSKDWSGSLTFSVNNKEYVVNVKRSGATSKVSLLENGIDISDHKVPDTYKKLSNILGMKFEVFSQLTYQSSTDLLDFIKATDTNRKKFLINLFGLGKYVGIGDALKVNLSSLEKDLATKNGEMNTVKSFLETTQLVDQKEEISVPEVDESLRSKIARLKNELEDYETQCKKIDRNNALIEDRNSLKFDMSLKSPELNDSINDEFETAKNNVSKRKNHISNINKQLKDIDTADKCYACGQQIDNTHSMLMKANLEEDLFSSKKELEIEEQKLQELQKVLDDYFKLDKEYGRNLAAIDKFENLTQIIDSSLPVEYPDYTQIETEAKKLSKTLFEQEKERDFAKEHNEQVKIHNTKLEALQEQKRQFLVRQQLLNDDIISLTSKIKNITILRKAFSTTGIVAFKLENLTKELEDTINRYLSELSDGKFQIIFRLEGEKLNIIVVNDGKESPVETVSGGEFSRIQTAILLSIRSLLSKIGGNYINLLFLDEITGVLDDAGKEKLIDILQEEDNMNVFLISHDFTHPLIEKVSIIKENNISYIE